MVWGDMELCQKRSMDPSIARLLGDLGAKLETDRQSCSPMQLRHGGLLPMPHEASGEWRSRGDDHVFPPPLAWHGNQREDDDEQKAYKSAARWRKAVPNLLSDDHTARFTRHTAVCANMKFLFEKKNGHGNIRIWTNMQMYMVNIRIRFTNTKINVVPDFEPNVKEIDIPLPE
jgi:hypothetical protein